MTEKWRRWWDTTEQKGHEYFGQFRVKPDKSFEIDNRSQISTVTQLRTGHGYFNSYLQRIHTSQIEDRGGSCNGAPPQMPTLHSSASTYATGNLSDSETSNRPPAIYQHGSQRDGPIYTAHRSGNQAVDAKHTEPNRQHRAKKSRMGDTRPNPHRTRYGLQRGVRR